MLKNLSSFIKTVILYFVFFVHLLFSYQVVGQEQFKRISINENLELLKLNNSFYIHVSWVDSEKYGRFSSNGLLLIKNGKALILDTPMEEKTTEELCTFLSDSMHVVVEKFIAGHSHDDCMGGIDVLHKRNVHSIALDLTKQKCIEQKLTIPKQLFSDSLSFDFYGERVKCIYAGPGHTVDNISVYFPDSKVLFGGCMVKSIHSKSLGNTAEAVVNEWDKSVEKLKSLCFDAKVVIPGHGDFGNIRLLDHTMKLLQENK